MFSYGDGNVEEQIFKDLREKIINNIDLTRDIQDDEIKDMIDDEILSYCKCTSNHIIRLQDRIVLKKKLFNSIRGYDILETMLEDDEITEIMINGPNAIFIEKKGEIYQYPGTFTSEERLYDVIQKIVSNVNRRVNESSPIVDTRLSDGSRVNVVLAPVALNGPVVTIRKFGKEVMSMEKLVEFGALNLDTVEFIKILVKSRYNIFVSGGTGSGKTTFLNAISNFIPEHERVITIEDSAELRLESIKNLVSLEVKQENMEGENGISIGDLIKSSLRMRPDRIIIGEIRGGEAFYLLSALNTGHDGSLSTGHANSARDMLKRITNMVLMGMDMPIEAIMTQVASGIDFIVHLSRFRDHSRKVVEISEVLDVKDGEIQLNPIYLYKENKKDTTTEKVSGKLLWTGNKIVNTEKFLWAGYNLGDIKYGEKN